MYIPLWLLVIAIVLWNWSHDASEQKKDAWMGPALGEAMRRTPTPHQDAYLQAEKRKQSAIEG